MTYPNTFDTDGVIFKHERSENISCNVFSMHTHNSYELIYFLEGDATHVIEDRKYKLKKGDLILIRPLQYHFIQIDSSKTYDRYDILFDMEKFPIESLSLLPEDLEVIGLAPDSVADDIFQRCDFYRKNYDEETFKKILFHLLNELFYNVHLSSSDVSAEISSLSPLISKALKYTNENLCTISGIKEIADHLFVSESYLFRQFQKELHQTPKKYILEKRLLLAQKMLQNGKKPSEVYTECGFSDYTTFFRNYLSFFGSQPSKK